MKCFEMVFNLNPWSTSKNLLKSFKTGLVKDVKSIDVVESENNLSFFKDCLYNSKVTFSILPLFSSMNSSAKTKKSSWITFTSDSIFRFVNLSRIDLKTSLLTSFPSNTNSEWWWMSSFCNLSRYLLTVAELIIRLRFLLTLCLSKSQSS